ncbi:hypothetical protein FGK63_08190 [Ruegeria sediminis]|uniref:Uncharacterized protein n=1 Tax=Ruegeria sediminis TaxID=2583820 RepID=A0ABY2X1H4_9RHOB|nr:hypothetical protein [Ruegeria sediminis]TMV09083.1 hypothetical protein FGK63_08190 [Ruegeria sediminis]
MANRSDTGDNQISVERELTFVLGHARRELRPQSVRLLRYLADAGATGAVDQTSIAIDVLGRGSRFRADVDSQVRVVVSRLRKDLAALYDGVGAFRPLRLSIPKGRYCVSVLPNDAIVLDRDPAPELRPFFVWTVSTEMTPEAMSVGHRIDRALAARFVQAPLVHDGALRADRIPPSPPEKALDEAQRSGAPCLALVVVRAPDQPVVLEIHCPKRDRAPIIKSLGRLGDDLGVDRLVRRIVLALTDPLQSVVPGRLARLFPNCRLALAGRFLGFMATQDHARLPACFDAFVNAAGSRLDSPLIRALRVDTIRSNYAFATGRVAWLRPDLVETAALVCESDPYQPYAVLAHAYATIATGADHPPELPSRDAEGINWEGSLGDDYELYQSLKMAPESGSDNAGSGHPGSFMADLAHILSAVQSGDIEQAADQAFKPRPDENFWTRVFQCSLAEDLGDRHTSRQIWAWLRAEVPRVEDFAGRAIVTMIPDKDLHSRLLYNLANIT